MKQLKLLLVLFFITINCNSQSWISYGELVNRSYTDADNGAVNIGHEISYKQTICPLLITSLSYSFMKLNGIDYSKNPVRGYSFRTDLYSIGFNVSYEYYKNVSIIFGIDYNYNQVKHKYSISDWEISELYRKCRDRSKKDTLEKMRGFSVEGGIVTDL